MPTRKPELVELTPTLLQHFHGEPYQAPIRGVAMVLDGTPIAAGGYADHGTAVQVFSYTTPEAKRYPILFIRASCLVMDWIDETEKPAFAFRDPAQPSAERFMSWLGFTQHGEVWRY